MSVAVMAVCFRISPLKENRNPEAWDWPGRLRFESRVICVDGGTLIAYDADMKNINKWTNKTGQAVTVAEAFVLAGRVHQWIEANSGFTQFNYLALSCNSAADSFEKWAASFDCGLSEEWYDTANSYPFGAYGATPEEAIFKAAERVSVFIEATKIEVKA